MYPVIRRQFPAQKKSTTEKLANGKKWVVDCIDAGITFCLYNSDTRVRDSKYNMRSNYRLYDGQIDPQDVEKTVNPWGLDASTFPAEMQCYPIATNKINLLVGEEAKRRFDWRLRVTNDDAVSEKEKMIKQTIIQRLTAVAMQGDVSEEKAQKVAAEMDKWRKYEAQEYLQVGIMSSFGQSM